MELAEGKVVKVGHNNYAVVHGDDNQCFVEFEMVPVQNTKRTEKEGCPQFDDVPFVKIMFPGDKTKVVFKKATDEHKTRFPKQWEAFQRQEKQSQQGYPLEQWPILTKSEVATLKALNIFTVEALANLPDTALTFLGGRVYREKAQATLAKAKDEGAILAVKAENEALKAEIDALKQQVKEIANLKSKKDKE